MIQRELKAPKNLYNSFGKYNYRNAEGILEAFKPYEEKYNVAMVLTDDVVAVGDRVYVKAEAILVDCESDSKFVVSAFAQEAAEKKGMDASQITGTASSYARKYALNGLFLLDDTKDADTDEYKRQTTAGVKVAAEVSDKLPQTHVKALKSKIAALEADGKVQASKILDYYHVKSVDEMSLDQFTHCMNYLSR